MKKRGFAALAPFLLLPALALGEITMTEQGYGETGSRLIEFAAHADVPAGAPGTQEAVDPVIMGLNMQIEARFAQEAAQTALSRAGAQIVQQGTLWQDGKTASMARTWRGEQADGAEGSTAAALTVNLETGMEIYMDELFVDFDAAVAHMEQIIERDVLSGMSDYMEYSDLLPMPTDSYSIDQSGLTVYWPQDRYRYFDGESGSVTFYWHELADFIGEGSPVYALAHPQLLPDAHRLNPMLASGELEALPGVMLGAPLERAAAQVRLADPDYTTDALVYPLERMRGFALEIPKYAETAEDETPISAIRAARISLGGMLATGKSTEADIVALLGQPQETAEFDEDAALDAMLDPGVSLYYALEGRVLQLHVDEAGVLSMVILRDAMPESLF